MNLQRVFELPVWRWDQIVDWLEGQDRPDVRDVAYRLVQDINGQSASQPAAHAGTRLSIVVPAGGLIEHVISTAIVATGSSPR